MGTRHLAGGVLGISRKPPFGLRPDLARANRTKKRKERQCKEGPAGITGNPNKKRLYFEVVPSLRSRHTSRCARTPDIRIRCKQQRPQGNTKKKPGACDEQKVNSDLHRGEKKERRRAFDNGPDAPSGTRGSEKELHAKSAKGGPGGRQPGRQLRSSRRESECEERGDRDQRNLKRKQAGDRSPAEAQCRSGGQSPRDDWQRVGCLVLDIRPVGGLGFLAAARALRTRLRPPWGPLIIN